MADKKPAPIPVLKLEFVDNRQPVLGASSTMTTAIGAKTHRMFFYPWFRGYHVTHRESGHDQFIHEHRVINAKWECDWPDEPAEE